ncbi:DUF4232 domain-containing protein [Jatrophihabitans sp.]|jgi:hypothetical protein|uniref:DUF4232 domain-containing protein n=1 Tax=Jatrophihabitans sp. TaxID=1932789 RepID=UPI002EF36FEA
MTPEQLDTAIRDELRAEARRAPAAAPVKAQVLLATRSLPADDGQPRALRAWLVPMLAAAAVLLVMLGVTAGLKVLNSDGPGRTPPAGSSTPPTPHSTTPNHWWYQHVDEGALPHTPGLCPTRLTAGPLPPRLPSRQGPPELPTAQPITVPGEPEPLWLLPVTCNGATADGSYPLVIEVFRYRPDGPQLVQTLAYQQGDERSLMVVSIGVTGTGDLELTEKGYGPMDELCCRSLWFTQEFTWRKDLRRYDAGRQVAIPAPATLPSCTGAQLKVTQSPLSGPGDSRGVLLRYVNTGPKPCQLNGYPHAAIVDAAGRLLAEASPTSTLAGALGRRVSTSSGLEPGSGGDASWWAVIEWETVESDGAQCYPHARLQSTPPDTTATHSYGDQGRVCYLQVHPVVPGDPGIR